MSLVDALLLEPAPFEVWIAIRPDGQKGSGRIDDPWDGGAIQEASAQITSITFGGAGNKDATVTTSANHGYLNGQYIRVTGATGADAGYYNGAFIIFGKTDTTFKYRMKRAPAANATGTLSSARIVGYRFDDIMRDLPANTTVRLGPGVFETKGYTPANPNPWQPKTAQKIIGSGIGATTLRIMQATIDGSMNSAIGGPYNNVTDSFEATDFTIDCNLPNQPIPESKHWAPVACGAIAITGRDIRIRRIRVINFGTQTPAAECFVIVAAGAHPDIAEPVNCIIEDCIAEQPSENNVRETSILHFGGGERPTDGVNAFYRACAIRNCYVNCEYRNGAPSHFIGVESLTRVDPNDPATIRKWRLKTLQPHHRTLDHNVNIFTVIKPNTADQASPAFNGTFPIDAIVSDKELDITLYVDPDASELPPVTSRAQIGAQFHATSADGGTATVVEGNRVFGTRVAGPYHDSYSSADQIVRNNFYWNVAFGANQTIGGQSTRKTGSVLVYDAVNSRAIFTCHEDHGLNTNDTVTISDGAVAPTSGADWLNNPFNRSNVAITRIDDKRFSYPLLSAPATNAVSAFLFKKTTDSAWKIGIGLIRESAVNPTVAVFTAASAHGLQNNDQVDVSGAFVWNSSATRYEATLFNGSFAATVIDSVTFKYTMSGAAPASPIASPSLQRGTDPKKCGSVILRVGNVATFSTVLAHGFSKRQAVIIEGARVNDDPTNVTFNGNYEVSAVPTATSFSYEITNPPTPVTSGGLPDFRALWQVRQFTVENNMIRLTKISTLALPGFVGIAAADNSGIPNHTFPYIYRQALARGNIIVQPESDANSFAIFLASIEAGIVENNLVSMARAAPVVHQSSGFMKYFNNLATPGTSLPGVDNLTQQRAAELAADVEEIQVLAMFN